MDDLDALLEDLGRPKSAVVKKSRTNSSRVDLNELEDLMQDLAAPAPGNSYPLFIGPFFSFYCSFSCIHGETSSISC